MTGIALLFTQRKVMDKILIVGYGNLDREDDGLAWHVLAGLAARLGRSIPDDPDEGFQPAGEYPHLYFTLQLTPEMSEMLSEYDRVCLVDAHTGTIKDDLNVQEVLPQYQASAMTHHLTPASLLSFTEAIYHHHPQAILVSGRGFEFGFSRILSPQATALAGEAVRVILDWIETRKISLNPTHDGQV
jgi:Ni,Fe-hydrogenase maturation factor